MKTIITAVCKDQQLVLTSKPVIASGGVNEDSVHFTFDESWDGFEKTAVFFRTQSEVYHCLLVDDTCVIPSEVIAEDGDMYFGVFGVKGEKTKTSQVISYKIDMGAVSDGIAPEDPTPSIYSQILTEASNAVEVAESVRADADAGAFDGITPHIGENGNWWIGDTDTGVFAGGTGGGGGVGADGGYYTPSVSAEGILTWEASKEDMPPIPSANVKGERGEAGESGADGVSCTHSWNGTTLSVTSASGASSANLKGERGDKGDAGADGVSPTVAVSKSGKVTTISITDANGKKTATINDGADGAAGSDGNDGVGIKSVVQTTTSSADGGSNVVTVTKTDGTTSTFTVKNGSKGSSGSDGKDGSNGKDGTSVTVSSVSTSTADGGNNIVTFSDGKTLTVKNGSKGGAGEPGAAGDDGEDGFGIFPCGTNAPTSTGATATALLNFFHLPSGYTLRVGDMAVCSNGYLAKVTAISGSNVTLLGTGISIKGSTGEAGTNGVGVSSVAQTTTSTTDGGSNVVTVTLTDGTKSTFSVKNGSKGSTGEAGAAGSNGTSVTVKSVSESTADGGNNVVTFSDGKTLTIKNGSKGSTGAAYTLTAADKSSIAAAVKASLATETWTFELEDGSTVTKAVYVG